MKHLMFGIMCWFVWVGAPTTWADYNYTLADSTQTNGPSYFWIDIHETGTLLITNQTASGGQSFRPTVPMVVYGRVLGHFQQAVVSVEGYLAFPDPHAAGGTDNGLDNTPDCVLPTTPSEGGGHRLYVYHANLRLATNSVGKPAGVYYQYFDQSPHPHHNGGVHVITWRRALRETGGGPELTFQALVFDNGDIITQYQPAMPTATNQFYTIGIQNDDASTGHVYSSRGTITIPPNPPAPCSLNTSLGANLAVRFEPARRLITAAMLTQAGGYLFPDDGKKHIFDPALNGQTVVLTDPMRYYSYANPNGSFETATALIIDASTLPNGITLRRTGNSHLQHRTSFAPLELQGGANEAVVTPRLVYLNNITFQGGATHAVQINDSSSVLLTEVHFARSPLSPATEYNGIVFRDLWNPSYETSPGSGIWITPDPIPVRGGLRMRRCSFSEPGHAVLLEQPFEPVVVQDSHFERAQPGGMALGCIDAFGSLFTIERTRFHGFNFLVSAQTVNGLLGAVTAQERLASFRFEDVEATGFLTALRPFTGSFSNQVLRRCTFEGRSSGSSLVLDYAGNAAMLAEHCTFSGTKVAGNNFPLIFDQATLTLRHGTVVSDGIAISHVKTLTANSTVFAGSGIHATNIATISASYCLFENGQAGVSGVGNLQHIGAQLLPLAPNGGFTRTRLPGATSPVFDAGDPLTPFAADQRGFPRVLDTLNTGTNRSDMGAVEIPGVILVTTATDENIVPGTGVSLREAIAAVPSGGIVSFDPAMNGRTNVLILGALAVNKQVVIDASKLSQGFIVDGAVSNTLFNLAAGQNLSLHGMALQRGRQGISGGTGSILTLADCRMELLTNNNMNGGAIQMSSSGHVDLTRTRIRHSAAFRGGGIHLGNNATMNLLDSWIDQCTAIQVGGGMVVGLGSHLDMRRSAVTRCTAPAGGGISGGSTSTAHIENSTIGENTGGGLTWGNGKLFLFYSTVYLNEGGGLVGSLANTVYNHSIIAANLGGNSLSNVFNGISSGNNLTDGTAGALTQLTDRTDVPVHLTPLGWHGGPTPTYAPLTISPAQQGGVDGFSFSFVPETDQRGQPRRSLPDFTDIGAVQSQPALVVTTIADKNDANPGLNLSLREALRDCPDGGRVLFDAALNGQTNTLTLAQLELAGRAVMIDATSLPRGFTLRRSGASRVVNVTATGSLSMHGVSLTGGNANLPGGGLRNAGRALLTRGAIYNNQTAQTGGGVASLGEETHLELCTISGNQTTNAGGGIHHSTGSLRVRHSTFVDNTSTTGGGAIHQSGGQAEINHNLFESNVGIANDHTLRVMGGILTSTGYNMEDAGNLPGPNDLSFAAPKLAGLAHAEGWGPTHAIPANSDARDAGRPSFAALRSQDQRGIARGYGQLPDIGAYEFGGYRDWIAELTTPDQDRSFHGDANNDGVPNGVAYLLDLHPNQPAGGWPVQAVITNNFFTLQFSVRQDRADAGFSVWATTDLMVNSWLELHRNRNGIDAFPDFGDSYILQSSVSGNLRTLSFFHPFTTDLPEVNKAFLSLGVTQ
ncbi:MAG TPA: choice-of-anchor Q domain-containing protein [Kiritimatiellia bacterium]|nr:choice-of-anchor Q domain-containing protein [Kiritimatiellia bacterium]